MRRWLIGLLLLAGLLLAVAGLWPSELPNRRLSLAAQWLSPDGESIPPQQIDLSVYQVLDARSTAEYAVSHLPGAVRIGYEDFPATSLATLRTDRPLLLYCSIGVRSGRIADSLRSRGFAEVYNLHGGIFAWAEAERPLRNAEELPTDTVHGYSRLWVSLTNHGPIWLPE